MFDRQAVGLLFHLNGSARKGCMPRISICVPHWQVLKFIQPCLRSIRKHSRNEDVEVLVIDNGSKDASLDYLRGLDWIRLIERPEEQHTNWPRNVFTAWDRGIAEARGEFFVTMHSDTFVKSDGWLKPLVRALETSPKTAGSGAWKLEIEHPLFAAQKRFFGLIEAGFRRAIGKKPPVGLREGHFPRDYCAMYRREVLIRHNLTFQCLYGQRGGGYSIARQLWEHGYQMGMVPVREMARHVEHIAHGTAAVRTEKRLNSSRTQKRAENKTADLFAAPWIQALIADESLDQPQRRVA